MPQSAQVVDQLQGVDVVGDAEVGPDLLPLDVAGVDAEQDVGLVLELLEQPHLDVGVEAGQDAGGVIVEEQLAAELQVELVVRPPTRSRIAAVCSLRYLSLSKPMIPLIPESFLVSVARNVLDAMGNVKLHGNAVGDEFRVPMVRIEYHQGFHGFLYKLIHLNIQCGKAAFPSAFGIDRRPLMKGEPTQTP